MSLAARMISPAASASEQSPLVVLAAFTNGVTAEAAIRAAGDNPPGSDSAHITTLERDAWSAFVVARSWLLYTEKSPFGMDAGEALKGIPLSYCLHVCAEHQPAQPVGLRCERFFCVL